MKKSAQKQHQMSLDLQTTLASLTSLGNVKFCLHVNHLLAEGS